MTIIRMSTLRRIMMGTTTKPAMGMKPVFSQKRQTRYPGDRWPAGRKVDGQPAGDCRQVQKGIEVFAGIHYADR
jgi:hypothetical protein